MTMIRIVLLMCSVGCVLGQNTNIHFPGQTNANNVHNAVAENNRNTVLAFIAQPDQAKIPDRPNPFQVPVRKEEPSAGNGQQQRPEQSIRPIQSAPINPPFSTGVQQGNQGSTNIQQNRPLTHVQAPQTPIHTNGQQTAVFIPQPPQTQMLPPLTNSNSMQNTGQGFAQSAVARPLHTNLQQPTAQSSFPDPPPPNRQFSPYVFFAYHLFANSKTGTQNLVLSPILTQATLALLQHGAAGVTRQQIGETVQTPLGSISQLIATLKEARGRDQQTVIEYASTVFISNSGRLNRTFAAIADLAKSSVVPVDFRNPTQTVQIINSWVSQATRRAIPSILDQNADTRQLEIMLANAIYFKSNWKYAFKESEQGYFYKAQANRKPVTFIKAKQYFPTGFFETNGRSGGAHWVEIPYDGEEYAMVILVPRFRDTLLSLISELTMSHVQTIINQLGAPSRQLVDLKLPKFDIETRTSLVGSLRDMGLGGLFVAPSELVYINENQSVSVGDCLHNARLAVDETGTIAAAANAFSIIPLSISQPDPETPFIVDQPFVAMILDMRNKYPLFLAKIFDP